MITAHSLTKRYGDGTAVDDLTFEVPSGEVTGFLGPNGSGKSTTMRMIMGVDVPDSGSALIDGKRYCESPPSIWRELSVGFERPKDPSSTSSH